MPKSKVRKGRKKVKLRIKPTGVTVIKNSEKEMLEGAIAMQRRDEVKMLNYIKLRKQYNKDSKQYANLTFLINTLKKDYNFTAKLFNLDTI